MEMAFYCDTKQLMATQFQNITPDIPRNGIVFAVDRLCFDGLALDSCGR